MNFYMITFISLAKDSSLTLNHIGRAPRHVKMVKRAKLFLYVHTESHLECRTDYY